MRIFKENVIGRMDSVRLFSLTAVNESLHPLLAKFISSRVTISSFIDSHSSRYLLDSIDDSIDNRPHPHSSLP